VLYAEFADQKLYCEDFLDFSAERNVNLIVTSPPYNVAKDYGAHDDASAYSDYLDFTRAYLAKLYDLAAPDGRLCLNVPLDKNKGGQRPVGSDILQLALSLGWRYHSTIVWNEGNISRRTAWGSWLNASAPYVIAPVELILVLYKGNWRRPAKGRSSAISREEFMAWTNGLWTFNGASARRLGHPAPFPVELPLRCIKLFSFTTDTVLDPFCGSGSTLLACLETGRKGIGVELESRFCDLALRRLNRACAPALAP
jgi:site-specific DNA-methyltransferase (adenine-specific)